MVGGTRRGAIFVESDVITPRPPVISRTGQAGPAPIVVPGVNAPQVIGCSSGCPSAGNGVGGQPSGLKQLGTTALKIQDYGRGVVSRAIGGISVLLTPPAAR